MHFSGGCFLNITANDKLRHLFNNIHIPPNTTDSGIHFGAAAWGVYRCKEKIEMPHNIALLGKSYNDKEIQEAIGFNDLKNIGEIKYNKYKDMPNSFVYSNKKNLLDNFFISGFSTDIGFDSLFYKGIDEKI